MTKNAAQLWDVLKKNNVPRQFYFHQGGHSNPLPNEMANRWFTKYLWSQDNGVQNQPKSWVVREADQCPARNTTVVGAVTASTDAHRRRRERRTGSATRSTVAGTTPPRARSPASAATC